MAMADEPLNDWQKWNAELETARKTRGYKPWIARGEKIIKRYRDQRTDEVEYTDTAHSADSSRFNILWSNVQTLMPAVFAKRPKPVVERRYLDRDEVGRAASVILERALKYELDTGDFFEATRRAVLDRLLPGRGQVWVRYEPTFRTMPAKTQEPTDEAETGDDDAEEAGENPAEETAETPDEEAAEPDEAEAPEEEKIYECVAVDYLDWKDFLTSNARTWEEVWWAAKRVYLTDKEGKARFPDTWKNIKLDWTPTTAQDSQPGVGTPAEASKAKVWEIWDKRDRKVRWITESENMGELLDEVDDPLKLEGFFPCPKPVSATMTNETMIPVPDFAEYQDQAEELDDLTGRITALTKAIKVAGVYDASIPELQRLCQEGKENELIGVDNMAEFSSKAGASGMGHIWLLPVKDMAEVLLSLYQAREQVKQSLYEITGISDIVRGQAGQGGTKTATEQRIKGQFASLRLNDIQSDVSRFARDVLAIMGEIIAEHYSPETLMLVSAYAQYAKEQFLPDDPPPPFAGPPQGPQPGMGGPPPPPMSLPPPAAPPPGAGAGGSAGLPGAAASLPAPMPPMGGPPGLPMGMPMGPSPQQIAAQKAAELFTKAIQLLRNDKLRGFRIDVETDSMIEPDQQATQQSRVEFLTAVGAFLEKAVPMGQMNPKFMPILGKMLLFMARSFRAGRELESSLEQAVDDLDKQAKNPPPKQPTPEEIKAQAEVQSQIMESQRADKQAALDAQAQQQKMVADQQKAAADMAMREREAELREREMMLEFEHQQRMLALKEREMQMVADAKQQEHSQNIDFKKRSQEFDLGSKAAAQADPDKVMKLMEGLRPRGFKVVRGVDGRVSHTEPM